MWEELLSAMPGNKLQFRSSNRYSSKLSASILSITLSKNVKRSEDDTSGHKEWLGSGSRGLRSKAFNITRTEVSTNFKIDATSNLLMY